MVTRGQVATMHSSFVGLGAGLAFAILLVYLLIVINFQSWSEAFIIITALPAALAGICWMLYLTQTTLSVPALMGIIMSMGVATANSVLIISFANERFAETKNALGAALEAGAARLRWVRTLVCDDHGCRPAEPEQVATYPPSTREPGTE